MRSLFDLKTRSIYLGNTKRRLLNSGYFPFAVIRARSKSNSSWSIRCGVVWRIFSNEKKATIGAETCFQFLVLKKYTFSQNCPVDLDEDYLVTTPTSMPSLKEGKSLVISPISKMMELNKKLEQQFKRAWFWRSLGRNLHRDLNSSRLLLDQKDWTQKQRFSCGRTYLNLEQF